VGSKLSEMVDITFLYKDLLNMANSEDPVFQTVVKPEDEERLSKQIRLLLRMTLPIPTESLAI